MEFSSKQLGVYALIAIFILSTIAIYFGRAGSSQEVAHSTQLISGYATASATLSSYDPTLELKSTTDATEKKIKELKEQGKIIQNIKTSTSTLLTVSDANDIPQIASILQSAGAKVFAQATINTGEITFVSASGTQTLESFAYRTSLEPVFAQGEKMDVTFSAKVLDGHIYSYSTPSLVPSSSIQLQVTPKDVQINSSTTQILIPFEKRNLNLQNFNQSDLLNYSRRSFITFAQPVADSTLQKISLNKPSYITSLQPTSFSINSEFTNSSTITQYLSSYDLQPIFPPSILNIKSQNNSELVQNFLNHFNEINATQTTTYTLEFTMPNSIEYENKTYSFPKDLAYFQSQTLPVDGYVLTINAEPVRTRIARYSVVSYGPSQ